MNFELGKSYIVEVTKKGIIPLMEFDYSEWYNKDYDDLEFLTEEEKIAVINDVLDNIRAEIIDTGAYELETSGLTEFFKGINYCLSIIDKYMKESEEA